MRQDAQKQSRKFCRSKEGKNSETHPIQPEKGETGCVLGAGGGGSGWERIKLGAKSQSLNQNEPHSHAPHAKRNPAETQCFRRVCGRGRRTCLGCRLGQRWTVATGDQRPTTRTAGEPAGAPRCQILPHTNEKVRCRRSGYLTFLAGAEGLEPSARGFGVDVGKCSKEQGRAGVARFLPQVRKGAVLVWCWEEIIRAKTGEKERKIPAKAGNTLT